LTDDEMGKLTSDTQGQLTDGAGENGFDTDVVGRRVCVYPNPRSDLVVEQVEDGTAVPPPSRVAIAAREGDLAGLRKAIADGEEIEGRLQGYTGLHLAILYAHEEEAAELLSRGADPNALDPDQESALHLCAVSNSLGGLASAAIARRLLEAGAKAEARTPQGYTAFELAALRKKGELVSLLKSKAMS
jgi:hypothetical protein